jgi:hypothetical protein
LILDLILYRQNPIFNQSKRRIRNLQESSKP